MNEKVRKRCELKRLAPFIISLLLIFLPLAWPVGVLAGGPNRVALIVVHGDGSLVTRCISFDESEITGADVLRPVQCET